MSDNTETKYWIAEKRFKEVDNDGSNDISIHEAYNYHKNKTRLMKRGTFSLEKEFATMDKNNDGTISPSEFDESL